MFMVLKKSFPSYCMVIPSVSSLVEGLASLDAEKEKHVRSQMRRNRPTLMKSLCTPLLASYAGRRSGGQ